LSRAMGCPSQPRRRGASSWARLLQKNPEQDFFVLQNFFKMFHVKHFYMIPHPAKLDCPLNKGLSLQMFHVKHSETCIGYRLFWKFWFICFTWNIL